MAPAQSKPVREARWTKDDTNKLRRLCLSSQINPRRQDRDYIAAVNQSHWPNKSYRNFAQNYRRHTTAWTLHSGEGKLQYYYSLLVLSHLLILRLLQFIPPQNILKIPIVQPKYKHLSRNVLTPVRIS